MAEHTKTQMTQIGSVSSVANYLLLSDSEDAPQSVVELEG